MYKLNYHVACATRNTVVGLAVAFCDEFPPRGKSSMHCQYPCPTPFGFPTMHFLDLSLYTGDMCSNHLGHTLGEAAADTNS